MFSRLLDKIKEACSFLVEQLRDYFHSEVIFRNSKGQYSKLGGNNIKIS